VIENAAPFDVENFLFEFVYPALDEAIQFEKKSLSQCDETLKAIYCNSGLSTSDIDRVFLNTHTARVEILHECLTHPKVQARWKGDNLNQFVEQVAQLTFVDFLPLELNRADSSSEFLVFSPWLKSTSYPYRLNVEEISAMKLMQQPNLFGGPAHDLYFRLNLEKLAKQYASKFA
jgi:hypothetical protein